MFDLVSQLWLVSVVCPFKYCSAIKRNEIMPFAATWIDREIIIVSEGSQRKMNITWYDLRVKSKIRHKKLIYEIETSLSLTVFWSLLKVKSIESVMPSNHLVLCCPLFLLPSIFPRIRVFSNESLLHITWPKYWSFSFSISPSNEYSHWLPTSCN